MVLTIGALKKIIESLNLSDDVVLADLRIGNENFYRFGGVKRVLLLKDKQGQQYLTINSMGSHFTGNGQQIDLAYEGFCYDGINER